jgi:hypothetical protein
MSTFATFNATNTAPKVQAPSRRITNREAPANRPKYFLRALLLVFSTSKSLTSVESSSSGVGRRCEIGIES